MVHNWRNSKNIFNSRSELPEPKIKENWKEKLSDYEYSVLRNQGTERPNTGKYYQFDKEGIYKCKACKTPLFSSKGKYGCTCGWPGFFQPINEDCITYVTDRSHGMERVETLCTSCGSHLGHVFDDGPAPTGLRYCINSICLDFEEKKE